MAVLEEGTLEQPPSPAPTPGPAPHFRSLSRLPCRLQAPLELGRRNAQRLEPEEQALLFLILFEGDGERATSPGMEGSRMLGRALKVSFFPVNSSSMYSYIMGPLRSSSFSPGKEVLFQVKFLEGELLRYL